jgi:GH25 family lysozyme M1 (1,4-beta-N-acetylmuramidase)
MANLVMYDSITPSSIPSTAQYIAGYVNGLWPTYAQLQKQFPHAVLLSIAVNASANAECLDVETGDATIADVYKWLNQQLTRNVVRPVIYTQVSNIDKLMLTMNANGFKRSEYRLWSAHYGRGEHVCGPNTCTQTQTPVDGTQWTDNALGRNLDQSTLLPNFFSGE